MSAATSIPLTNAAMEAKRKHPHEASCNEPHIPPHKRRKLEREARPKLAHHQYTVGWICAIPTEYAAAQALLDEEHAHPHNLSPNSNDGNTYAFGKIGPHNVVMAVLAEMGIAAAAGAATNMQRSFPKIEIRLMVGIGGGAPTLSNDIRLGDVVVSTPRDGQSSVFQYDFGKDIQGQSFQQTGVLDQPPQRLRGAVIGLRARYMKDGHEIQETINDLLHNKPGLRANFSRPSPDSDKLYKSTCVHPRNSTKTCAAVCEHDPSNFVERPSRTRDKLVIHYGTIASANRVMKNAETRDKLAAKDHVLCFEMEAAGLSNTFPYLIIRGICDYSDSHKNKEWQGYAAMTAAVYAKDLLHELSPRRSSSSNLPSTEFQGPKAVAERERLADERRQQLLDSLSFDQIDARQMTIKKAHAQTCKWVLKSSEYLDWLDHTKREVHHGFLWIKGKPGTGKSTLMKFISANYRKTMRKGTLTTFFFNARGEQLEKSTTGMYRSLLSQLVKSLPQIWTVSNFPDLMAPNTRLREWTIELLKELLEELFRNLKDEPVTCFIDALDECDEDQIRDMVSFFEGVSEITTAMDIGFKVCFSSRHYPHITISKAASLILEGQEGHKDDIVKYVRNELRIGTTMISQQIRHELQEKASGVFMWVVLVVGILNKEHDGGRMHRLRQRLRELPGDLDALFRDILIRDRHRRDELLLCIQWVLFAKDPLSPKQLYFAILSGTEVDSTDALSDWDPEDITADVVKRFILDSSKGLAEVTKSTTPTVQFIHESVRHFLLKPDGLGRIWPEFGSNFYGQCHERLKICCLNYLAVARSMEIVKHLPEVLPENADELRKSAEERLPFVRYATQQVLYHSDLAEASGVSQVDFLQAFDLASWTALSNLLEKHKIRRHKTHVSLLYVLAEQNRVNLIRTQRSQLTCFEVEDERYGAPLFAALATGSSEAVHAFLVAHKEANPKSLALSDLEMQYDQKNTALYKPADKFIYSAKKCILSNLVKIGHERLAALVIERGEADVDAKDEHRLRTPLSHAAEKGLLTVVQFLLESGRVIMDRNEKDGMTSLAHAAKNGHDSVVKMLLSTGQVRPDNADRSRRTPFSYACRSGHDSVVKMLLAATSQVDPNKADDGGRTPFSHACGSGRDSIVKMLLAATGRVDPDKADDGGRTPFSYACGSGRDSIVKMLLAATGRVDPDKADDGGRTPFSYACGSGRDSIVKMLLAATGRVDPDKADDGGRTPFSHACGSGRYLIIKILLATDRIDPNHRSHNGSTPLWHAVTGCHRAIVQLLLESDQVEANCKNKLGETPMSHAATDSRFSEILRLFIRAGKVDVNLKGALGRTPLSCLLYRKDGRSTKDGRLLVETGLVDPNSRDEDGRTTLSWAAGYNDVHIFKALLENSTAQLDSKDQSGRTPLSHAAVNVSSDAVKLLLGSNQVEPDSKDNLGRTPLSHAAGRLNASAILALLKAGANPTLGDNSGKIPLSYANEAPKYDKKRQMRVVELLRGGAHMS